MASVRRALESFGSILNDTVFSLLSDGNSDRSLMFVIVMQQLLVKFDVTCRISEDRRAILGIMQSFSSEFLALQRFVSSLATVADAIKANQKLSLSEAEMASIRRTLESFGRILNATVFSLLSEGSGNRSLMFVIAMQQLLAKFDVACRTLKDRRAISGIMQSFSGAYLALQRFVSSKKRDEPYDAAVILSSVKRDLDRIVGSFSDEVDKIQANPQEYFADYGY